MKDVNKVSKYERYVVADAKDTDLINYVSDHLSDCVNYCKRHVLIRYPDYIIMKITYVDYRDPASWIPIQIFDTDGKTVTQ